MRDWVTRHDWKLIGSVWLLMALFAAMLRDWFTVFNFLLVAGLSFSLDRIMDRTFAAGWRASASAADDLIKKHITDDATVRIPLYYALLNSMPNRREYVRQWEDMTRELALMENPTPEDLNALYRRYHPEP